MTNTHVLGPQVSTDLHDAHTTHYEGSHVCKPMSNNYLRALELARTPIKYPSRVRVYTYAQAIFDAMETDSKY